MHPGKGQGECPGTLASRSPKGPVPALLKARVTKAAEREVSGRPSSPLLAPTPPCCGGLRSRREALRAGGGSPGTAACPRVAACGRSSPSWDVPHILGVFFRETRSSHPSPSPPTHWVAVKSQCWDCAVAHPCLPPCRPYFPGQDPYIGVESSGGRVCPR